MKKIDSSQRLGCRRFSPSTIQRLKKSRSVERPSKKKTKPKKKGDVEKSAKNK